LIDVRIALSDLIRALWVLQLQHAVNQLVQQRNAEVERGFGRARAVQTVEVIENATSVFFVLSAAYAERAGKSGKGGRNYFRPVETV
jgi:hypothetical protein